MNLQEWIAKLSKPYWMPTDPRRIVKNLTPEHIGQLNLMWVFNKRAQITQGFFDQNLGLWELAGRISSQQIDRIPVREYATLFTEAEFYEFVCKHPDIFTQHMPMASWKQHFKVRRPHV